MNFSFDRELRSQDGKLLWRHPRSAAVTIVLLPAVIGLVIALNLTALFPKGSDMRTLFILLWVAVTAFNMWWILWGSTLEFDQKADVIRRGPQRLGLVSEVQSVEQTGDARSPLSLVLASRNGAIRRVAISGLPTTSAVQVGTALAEALGVTFS